MAKVNQIELLPISEIKPYPNNPRKISDAAVDAVVASINKFGFRGSILLDSKKVIVAGHTRFLACKKIGMTEVPCVIAHDLSEEDAKLLRIADNKTGELSRWDFDMLKIEMKDMDLSTDVVELCFTPMELDSIVSEDPLFEDEDEQEKKPGGPRKKSIALSLEQYEIFLQAAAKIRENSPELKDPDVVVALAEEYLT